MFKFLIGKNVPLIDFTFLSLLIENIHIHYMYTVLKEVVEKERCLPNVCQIPVWDLSQLIKMNIFTASVQSLSHVQLFATPWTAAHQASLSITNSWSCLKFLSIMVMMPSNHLSLCRLLLIPPSIFPSIRVFSNESVLRTRWPKYWLSASASVLPMNIQDWFPLVLTGLISLQSKEHTSPWIDWSSNS